MDRNAVGRQRCKWDFLNTALLQLPLCNTVAKIAVLSGKTGAVLEGPTCSMFLTVHFPERFQCCGSWAQEQARGWGWCLFLWPFCGISRSVAPVLLVTLPLKAEQSSGAVSWPLALFRVTCLAFKLAQGDFSLLLWHCLSSVSH